MERELLIYLSEMWLKFLCFGAVFFGFLIIVTKKMNKWHETKKYLFFGLIVVFVAYIGMSIPIFLDLANKSYVVAENVKYQRIPDDKSSFFGGYVDITSQGEVISLVGASEDYPYGTYYGTVIYAQHSKVILYFSQE